MGKDLLGSKELFEKIIRIWGARPDPSDTLTMKQIANLALGSGTDEHASIVGRTIQDFHDYFYEPNGGIYRWAVRWTRVERSHPALYPKKDCTAPTLPSSTPLADMMQALEDEIAAVKKDSYEHPIKALVRRYIGAMPDGSFWYEAQLELPGDSELPVPEGVQAKLQWPYALHVYPCEAKLLSCEPLRSTIIFEVERPLSDAQIKNSFKVLPNIEQLIQALQTQLLCAAKDRDRVVWRLLEQQGHRTSIPWDGSLVTNELDETQSTSLQSCLNHDITFLWGPPGTGKTHTLGRLMASAALSAKRVIACAISNIAVDQMALKVVEALESTGQEGKRLLDEGRVIRFGHPRDPDVTAEARLFPNRTRVQELRQALHELHQKLKDTPEIEAEARALLQHNIMQTKSALKNLTKVLIEESRIVLTTAVQACIEPAVGQSTFDMAVIDEASMMPVPYVLVVGALSSGRVIVTGDFKQLGPIALAQSAAAYRWLHKDPFELVGICGDVPSHPSLAMLQVQRRMHEKICSLINQPFYGGKLRTDTELRRAAGLPPLAGHPAVFVSFLEEHGSTVEQTAEGSRVNRKSAEFVTKLVCEYLRIAPESVVGVIAPYRGQVTQIRRLLRSRELPRETQTRIRLGTVHAFQGSEADIIIWDLVDNRHHKIGRLYHKDAGERLTNVAISRAKGKLILVGDPEAFFVAHGQESVGKLRAVIARHFHANSRLVVDAASVDVAAEAHTAFV